MFSLTRNRHGKHFRLSGLYTILTNKKAKGKAGSIVAVIAGTKAVQIIQYLHKIPSAKRNKVKEITLDMANTMKLIVKRCHLLYLGALLPRNRDLQPMGHSFF